MTRGSYRIERQRRNKTAGMFLPLMLSAATLCAAENGDTPPPAYKQLRYDENYQYLRDPSRRTSRRPSVVRLVGIAATLIGVTRVARLLRFMSVALTAYRIARNWRRMR